MRSAQKIKRLSRRERKEMARRAQNRRHRLTLVVSKTQTDPVIDPPTVTDNAPESGDVHRDPDDARRADWATARKAVIERRESWEKEFLNELEAVLGEVCDSYHGFGLTIWKSRFVVRSEETLLRLTRSSGAIREAHLRLAGRRPSEPNVPRFMLFSVRRNGPHRIFEGPTHAGLDAWSRMRNRLLRGRSTLARRLMRQFGP